MFLSFPLRAEIIDRILAVVGGEPIMQSDAIAALRFGIIEVPAETADPAKLPRESNETTHFSIIDSAGNAVSNTYTLNFSFGVGVFNTQSSPIRPTVKLVS